MSSNSPHVSQCDGGPVIDIDEAMVDSEPEAEEIESDQVASDHTPGLMTHYFKRFEPGNVEQEAQKKRNDDAEKKSLEDQKLKTAQKILAREEEVREANSKTRKAQRQRHRARLEAAQAVVNAAAPADVQLAVPADDVCDVELDVVPVQPKKLGRPKGSKNKTSYVRDKVSKPAVHKHKDSFLLHRTAVNEIYKVAVDPATRQRMFKVTKPSELYNRLLEHNRALFLPIPKTTLTGWFTYPKGRLAAPDWPQPKDVFQRGYSQGFNVALRCSTGRPITLPGCEDEFRLFETTLENYRAAGVALNMPVARDLLVDIMVKAGKADMLSPHLMEFDGKVDTTRFVCSGFWLGNFLSERLHWTKRVGTKAAQALPDDHEELIEDTLHRIAAMARGHNVPKERLYLADETFVYLHPSSKYTYAPTGSQHVAIADKEAKDGVTCMVGSTGSGAMLPMLVIAKGSTQQTLTKFLDGNPSFTELDGGWRKKSYSIRRSAMVNGSKVFAEYPPHYSDPQSGHVIAAGGDKTHFMNVSTLRLWITKCVWPHHQRLCESGSLDPKEAIGIVHIDAYPVHISEQFRHWLKEKYPSLRLIYVPANCTSAIQFADVVLNKPFKGYLSHQYTKWMIKRVQEQIEAGKAMKEISFDDLVTQAAGPALTWMITAYEQLGTLDHVSALTSLGYMRCWDDNDFVLTALHRAGDLLKEALPRQHANHVEPAFNDTDLELFGGLLDIE